MNQNKGQVKRNRANNQIRVPEVKVLDSDGNFIGVMNTNDAIRKAQMAGLDLVEINPNSNPPVCKIVELGKFKYDEKKKAQASNKSATELKEIKLGPNTEENDLNHKIKIALEFLEGKNKVKFSIKFRGREITHPQLGRDKLEFILNQIGPVIAFRPNIVVDGKIMSMIVDPKK